jgi:hypothetical protein
MAIEIGVRLRGRPLDEPTAWSKSTGRRHLLMRREVVGGRRVRETVIGFHASTSKSTLRNC